MSNVAPLLPVAIPPDAPLPQKYEAARAAIAECDRIDECKDWKDKAAALASYARQAKDDYLRVMAVRIQARAERRCGELLKQIRTAPGARTDLGSVPSRGCDAPVHGRVGAVPPVTRTQAAIVAGLSERQRKTALRVATVPAAAFEAHVESSRPPSITQLANLGKETRPAASSPWQHIECTETRAACETLERFAKYCEESSSEGIARAVNATEAQAIQRLIAIADEWLNRLATNLSAEA